MSSPAPAPLSPQLIALFKQVEDAIDAHPMLTRLKGPIGEIELRISSSGRSLYITVRRLGPSGRTVKISGWGPSDELAAHDLIVSLDVWAKSL
jgi:hypothetical protein